ncbi:membrane protease YdiL (CAAX protease family) [Caldanaerobacter subterraneus subsp. tengcongensis MB4]|uniref:Predicted metal-dependent membrane protease n=1 Tax=Caldanaerobacter subterraneus subsp. tengcongensis (strain DSM 15242 / JCM 11007 / NBRC 100824 / MB4) TaxID=273068 RepID=Q8R747_CALS4|nr:type II CAAX endopeptidase family protein [Caldanaerobacter subterraneus]AAM25701.1 predicted metal-dependent membrane protease [Caldanaerobacter subterraneus subsp. tengcongensis MB4]MCS3917417.1 membrane protease YdiL (CAAX protease family) [Caldanaerobacter subterraneus subsp. tengcongensis MB4]
MRPDEKDVGKLYFSVMVLFITLGYLVQKASLYIGILITEIVFVLIPVIVYLLIKRYDVKYVLRLNPLKSEFVLLLVFIAIASWGVSGFLAVLTNYFLSKLGKVPVMQIPPAQDFNELIIQLIIFGLVAACCEEIFMRGLVMRSFEMRGSIKSVVITAILFAMLHLNVQNFLSILFLGTILGYVVYRTDSIFAGMIVHFTNNAISTILSYFISQSGMANVSGVERISIPFSAVLFYGVIAVFSGMILYALLRRFTAMTTPYVIKGGTGVKEDVKVFLYWPFFLSILIFLYRVTWQMVKIAQ